MTFVRSCTVVIPGMRFVGSTCHMAAEALAGAVAKPPAQPEMLDPKPHTEASVRLRLNAVSSCKLHTTRVVTTSSRSMAVRSYARTTIDEPEGAAAKRAACTRSTTENP